MKRSRWAPVLTLCGTLALVAGCNRNEPQTGQRPPTPAPQAPRVVIAEPILNTAAPQTEPPPIPVAESHLLTTNVPQRKVLLAQAGDGPIPGFARSKRERQDEAEAFLENPSLVRISIEIPRAGLNALRRSGWGNGQERPEAMVTVRENGVVYTNVSLHLKGSAGSFRPIDDKPAMTLKFDAVAPEQSFHGLNKISLNNSVQDSSYLCEKLARELFISAGVPVPQAAHALVTLNGRDLGLYVLLEGANKRFLKRHFKNAKGNLYDGGFCQDLRGSLSVNSGDNPKDHTALRALVSAVRQNRSSLEPIEQVLDVDRFISMLALEMMLSHWDGYTMNRNNWRVFHDQDSGKMVFIPHGLDQLFGRGRPTETGNNLLPQHVSGDVSRVVLGTREGQRRYRERVGQLFTNLFNLQVLLSRVDELSAGVGSAIAESDPNLAKSFQRQAGRLKGRIEDRYESLREQLGAPVNPLRFGETSTVLLTGWKVSNVQSGEPTVAPVKDANGKLLMGIDAGTNGTSSSSWRTRATLEAGRYQFQGHLRVNEVTIDEGDTRAGAGLRISKGNMPRKVIGSTDWVQFNYDFTVESEFDNVEFVCELRANKGQVWFDPASLRLVRMEQ